MEIIVRGYKCQDDQGRIVTVTATHPRGLKDLLKIVRGTYRSRVKVELKDHPERHRNLWDPHGGPRFSSPLSNHKPLTRDTIKYKGTVIRVGDHDLENTR